MKFTCERCGKKYATAEDPAPGRVYKLKCKACGHLIVVKPATSVAAFEAPAGTTPLSHLEPSIGIEIEAPEPSAPPDRAPRGAARDATSEVSPESFQAHALELTPAPGSPGYVDLFSDVSGIQEIPQKPSDDPFASASRSSRPDAFGGAPSAPMGADPFADLREDISAASSPEPAPRAPPPIPKVPLIPKPKQEKSFLPLVLIGAGVAVMVGILAFVLLSSGKKTSPRVPAPAAKVATPTPTPPPPPAPEPAKPEPELAEPAPPAPPAPPAVRAEQARRERDEAAAKARAEREARERDEREAKALAKAEREAKDRAAREARAREAAEKTERDAAAKAEREAKDRASREARARDAAEKAERDAAAKAEREAKDRASREARAREAAEKAERDAAAKAEREATARAEREARLQREREAREAKERAAAEARERQRVASTSSQEEGDSLTQAQIEGVLRGTKSEFDACIQAARGVERLDGRRVMLRLNIQPTGAVTYPTLDDVTLNGTDLGSCLKSAARVMVFPKFKGDTMHVEVPLVMR